MANRYAVATGNWSNTATWDGGTLPGVGDDVRANGFTVTINQSITVDSIRNDALSPAVNGGGFTVNTTTFNNLTLTCNIIAHLSNCLSLSGAGNINVIGNINGGVGNGTNGIISTGTTGLTLNITGNCSGGSAQGNSGCAGVAVINSSFLNINLIGNCFGASVAAQNTNNGISVNGSGDINITGLCYGVGTAGLFITGNATTVNGSITSVASTTTDAVPGVYCSSTNTGVVVSSVINTNRGVGINGGVKLKDTSPTIEVITQSGVLVLTDPAATNPAAEADVRDGVVYGGGAYEGTLVVPIPSNVRLGIPTDNTVGTGIVTGVDFFNLISTSSDPVAERLRNVATVQTVGDQFNSF
jgi:hypothetical protein